MHYLVMEHLIGVLILEEFGRLLRNHMEFATMALNWPEPSGLERGTEFDSLGLRSIS